MSGTARSPSCWRVRQVSCLPLALSTLLLVSSARGEDAPEAEEDAAAPSAGAHDAAEQLKLAIAEASKRLKTLQSQVDKQAQEGQAKIAEEAKAQLALRDSEKKLTEKVRTLRSDLQGIEAKARSAAETKDAAVKKMEAAKRELSNQAGKLKDRLAGSLATAQDEQLLDAAGNIRSNPNQALPDQLDVLFELYERILGYSRSCALIQIPVRVAQVEDRIENLKVLRLGLLGGYFSRPASSTGGFVMPDPTAKTGFVADASGLSAAQQGAIVTLLRDPAKGGALPLDVTGGAALAQLRAADTPVSWFQRGGFWMWPLLGVAAAAAIVALECFIAIVWRFLSTRKAERQLNLILRSGRFEPDGTAKYNFKGLPGKVLQAAVDSRGRGARVMEAAVQETLLRNEQSLEGRLTLLSIAVGVAPLLGFLGTVAGLIATFKLLGLESYNQPTFLSSGLADALVPTQGGLFIGIASLALRGLLGLIADQILVKLERNALTMMSLLLRDEESRLEIGGLV